jgi:hypothetical protein
MSWKQCIKTKTSHFSWGELNKNVWARVFGGLHKKRRYSWWTLFQKELYTISFSLNNKSGTNHSLLSKNLVRSLRFWKYSMR